MNSIIHERPGVYSSYDASSAVSGAVGSKTIGVAALAVAGEAMTVIHLTSYDDGITAFGEDSADQPGMSTLLRLLFDNGASEVFAVRVAADAPDYAAAFALLAEEDDIRFMVCDSTDIAVHQQLRDSVIAASNTRKERIAVVGGSGESVTDLVSHAEMLNSERVLLVAPDMIREDGSSLPACFAAAAVAAAIAAQSDPSLPINGLPLSGFGGLQTKYSDNDIDILVRGGVTPLESVSGVVSPIRGITTRTKTGGADDATWRELTTILIIDDVIPTIRDSLRAKFLRSKNTAQTRGAIRSQVILELENKVAQQRIDSYSGVSVSPLITDPTVCLVDFHFAVAHGLNRIFLTAHITV